jgi:hypothetical protein
LSGLQQRIASLFATRLPKSGEAFAYTDGYSGDASIISAHLTISIDYRLYAQCNSKIKVHLTVSFNNLIFR